MFWKWLWKALAFLVILTIFAAGGLAIYKAGYANGITVGMGDANVGGDAAPPQVNLHPGYLTRSYGRPLMIFPLFGLCFSFFLLLFFIGGVRRFVHYKMWKSKGEQGQDDFRHQWHKAHRNPYWGGPCWSSKDDGKDRTSSDVQPDDTASETSKDSEK